MPEPATRYKAARSQFQQGYADAALKLADEGYRKLEARDKLWSWRFRLLESEILLSRGKFLESNRLLADTPPSNFPSDIVASRKILQGRALCRIDQRTESEVALNEAERLILPAEKDRQAELAFARGKCAALVNRVAARIYYRQSANLAHGPDPFIEARSLIELGYSLLKDRNYHQAITPLSDALAITDSSWLREVAMGNLAECYAELGDWRQSISLAEQAEKLAAQIRNDSDRKTWLIDLGRAHLVLAEYAKAESYYAQALPIAREQRDDDGIRRCLHNLTQLALSRHDLIAAVKYWEEESRLSKGAEEQAYAKFDAAGIAMERKEFPKAENLLKEILGSTANDSLRLTTQRELGEVYWQENKPTQADRAFRQAIKDVEDTVARIPLEYKMSFLDEDPFYDSYIRFLVAQGRALDALKIGERGKAQILSQALSYKKGMQRDFDLRKLQAALQERNRIALAYSLTNEESFLWVITPTQLKVFRLPSHEVLGVQVDVYNKEIAGPPRSIEESIAGQELYKALIQPANSLIPKGSRVVIIPSKILSVLSFESLIVPGTLPRYWINDVEIETASSLALLARSRTAGTKFAKSRKELLLLGAPLEADKAFPTLQNAPEEMSRVRSHFPADRETVISGKDAIPQSYRASNPGEYRFIHIDAHSAASELNPLDSFVVLSRSGNDYRLFAREITETRLRADLVTLSACYGAGTRWYQSEGIVGLGWAFLHAGAHQVVASLWPVDDASTPQLMDDFYGQLSQGKSAAEALRAAKLKMLHSTGSYSRPYYWASLQLYTGG